MPCRPTPLLLAVFVASCSEYQITPSGGLPLPAETGAPPADTADTADTAEPQPPDEECNGVDDDGDGQIDEGFGDADADGIKDCLDGDCEAASLPAGTATLDEECDAPDVEVVDPWNVAIEWQWTGLTGNPSVHNVIMTPVIGNLDDDDGDGDVDEDDTPDVVFVAFASTSFTSGTLVVLDGATGHEHWTLAGFDGGGGIALADVDLDGVADVLAFDSSRRPVAVGSTGSVLWTAPTSASVSYPQATVADVDGDGLPEVIADTLLLDGQTGAVRATLTVNGSIPYRMPAVGDLDQDGDQEIIVGNSVYDHTGALLWSTAISGNYGHWTAIIDYDGDPQAEVAMVGGGRLGIYDHDGTRLVEVSAGDGQPGAPCVADFDGDGAAEIGWASSSVFNLYELDGTRVWGQNIDDSSGLAACSGYDVDGDGAYEVMYADQNTFYILDGRTGAINFSQTGHASGTLWEYPSVADVDNDGSAEVVIASNNYWMTGWGGITVFGHHGDGWMKSGTTWHTHDFAVTNINSDGTVPAVPDPWWQIYNVYRARPAVDTAAIDLQAEIVQICFSGCSEDSPVHLVAQVSNTGGMDAEAGIPLSLYRVDGDTRALLETVWLSEPIASGTTAASVELSLTLADVGGTALVVVVDDDGTGTGLLTECDESNNQGTWLADPPC